jgi:hypothetical protein
MIKKDQMKYCILFLFLMSLAGVCSALDSKNNQGKAEFIVGGVTINIPAPDTIFAEAGDQNRAVLEVYVPQSNKLICAYVLKDHLETLFKDNNTVALTRSLVEVPRAAENMDCGESDFEDVVNEVKKSFGDMSETMRGSENELNSRLKSLDMANRQIKIGQPEQLGCFFSKQDRAGFGMVTAYAIGDKTIKMGITIMTVRVKKRLLFIYLYSQYIDDESIIWLRNTGEKWSEEILKANNL